jgi:hypothetical protein
MQVTPVLEQEFLPIRAKLLEIAAALDRFDRCEGMNHADPRLQRIHAAIEVLRKSEGDRAEQLQLVFSREYEEGWRDKFLMTNDD